MPALCENYPMTTPTPPAHTEATAAARFGLLPSVNLTEHPHIRVRIGPDQVAISELRQSIRTLHERPRCVLTRAQWNAIADLVAVTFNDQERRLPGMMPGRFPKAGDAALDVDNLGRELLVLCWAVETLDPAQGKLFDLVRGNWLRLDPVERWWLHNQTVAVNGSPQDAGHGWRAALMHALTADRALSTN